MSASCIDPKGSTLSLENPRRWALTGSSFSFPTPILSNVDVKMMSAELRLSTRTMCTVLLATALITRGIVMRMLLAFHVGVRESYGGV